MDAPGYSFGEWIPVRVSRQGDGRWDSVLLVCDMVAELVASETNMQLEGQSGARYQISPVTKLSQRNPN